MEFSWQNHLLDFKKPAITSRGEYLQKKVCLISLHKNGITAMGEASPLPDLSIEGNKNLEQILLNLSSPPAEFDDFKVWLSELAEYPSLQFAFECCYLGLNEQNILFDTPFTRQLNSIPINGLVWMDEIEAMEQAALKLIHAGFRCIKFKVGAKDHDSECQLLEKIRKQFSPFQLEMRLDANGAYPYAETLEILRDFNQFHIHSLEQPIKAGNWDAMQEICAKSPIPIALDEELIGVNAEKDSENMLRKIKPRYIIIKPTLLGGFSNCDQWIASAENLNIGWWATSALESNVGLGHIAQWVSSKNITLHQGLGTGTLYKNNFQANTMMKSENLWFHPAKDSLNAVKLMMPS